jgi:hypothetical protein
MLADSSQKPPESGSLSRDVHLEATSRYELIRFIAGELPHWRDDPQRPVNTAETTLTGHLCNYLNTAARMSSWDFLQFHNEATDEESPGRTIDFAVKPCGATIWIEGRRHNQYDSLLPVECK